MSGRFLLIEVGCFECQESTEISIVDELPPRDIPVTDLAELEGAGTVDLGVSYSRPTGAVRL